MTSDERRDMIVRAALPLVAAHGTAVTTARIARAAGIGEATIFRVFADKEELLDACVAEALRVDQLVEEIAAIPLDQPLNARLVEAAAAIEGHLARIGAVIGALHATGIRPHRGRTGRAATGGGGGDGVAEPPGRAVSADRDAAIRRTRDAVAGLFEPDRGSLRLPPDQLASIFIGLVFNRTQPSGGLAPALDDALRVFLYGALIEPEKP